MEERGNAKVILIVPKELVKTVKTALEVNGKLDKTEKIKPTASGSEVWLHGPGHGIENWKELFMIPTTASLENRRQEPGEKGDIAPLLKLIGLYEHVGKFNFLLHPVTSPISPTPWSQPIRYSSLLAQAISQWLESLPHSVSRDFISKSPWTYSIYPPLLLLPANTFSPPQWPSPLMETLRPYLPGLYNFICAKMNVTHIALNGYIPSMSQHQAPNILRSPNITPLHGTFAPAEPPSEPASSPDFASAFWCTARQNGIFQTWAPLHTMFSRGNISEKARLLSLPSLTAPGLGMDPAHTSAVDLYAGIGYFAFCYAKAGVQTVLCWELSAWSIEGLQRGASENGWHAQTMAPKSESAKDDNAATDPNIKFLIFHESNAHASSRIASLRAQIAPIRHVNCGLLPSSCASWETAVQALDPLLGGWVHVHENVQLRRLAVRREEILIEFKHLVEEWRGDCAVARERAWNVACASGFKVKGYGPGIGHFVFDVEILPRG